MKSASKYLQYYFIGGHPITYFVINIVSNNNMAATRTNGARATLSPHI